ncbi:MAG: efflux RND transporter permease subunit, partial [Planctomycetes bacterium]|nr:efflux RND transporter permease subunit [Planctomycetota bacterium]
MDEARASERGLTFYEVATALRGANDGLIAGLYKDNTYNEDLDIRVKYDRQYRMLPEDLLEIDIRNVAGQMIKLHEVADLRYDQSYASLYHYNSRRAVLVTCNVDAQRANALRINQQILDKFGPRAAMDDQLIIHAGGQFEETAKSFESLGYSISVAVMLIYLILAGQFRSFLNLSTLEDVEEAVRLCRESLVEPSVIEYCRKHGIDPVSIRMDVIIQRMIEPELAGVAFTVDPVTGAEQVVIEACAGLADELLAGHELPLPSEHPLLQQHRAQIESTALQIQRHFGAPQDIEFAVQGGTLYILQ